MVVSMKAYTPYIYIDEAQRPPYRLEIETKLSLVPLSMIKLHIVGVPMQDIPGRVQ